MFVDDPALDAARALGTAARANPLLRPHVEAFFDDVTFTVSYVVSDPQGRECAVIDSVLDFDLGAGRTRTSSADRLAAYIAASRLEVRWHLETHAHADHLSAALYLKSALGGQLAIGRGIMRVQEVFGKLFNAGPQFAPDGSEFDRLFDDGDAFEVGSLQGAALHVPGHTPSDLAYIIGDAVFVGDTLLMPDYGTARADFPGGDARQLFRSIRRLLSLPSETRIFVCHDYKTPGRDTFVWETSVAAERRANVHVRDGVSEDEFVAMRTTRDATLPVPRLILPSVQVNMRGGRLPAPEENGVRYLKIPLDQF
jgi:glyoxylase-like metal-dependent hydrolase (beta-lactamase superfamily II)